MQVNSDTDGTHCCVSMATFSGFILFTATCRSTAIQTERIVAFAWQQWSRERVMMLRNAWVSYLVSVVWNDVWW